MLRSRGSEADRFIQLWTMADKQTLLSNTSLPKANPAVLKLLEKSLLSCDNTTEIACQNHHTALFHNFHCNTLARARAPLISHTPVLVLDAPDLANDYRLNLIAWGEQQNMLAVGLGPAIYVRSLNQPVEAKTQELYDAEQPVCSVGWASPGSANQLAAGFEGGDAALFDVEAGALTRILSATAPHGRISAVTGCSASVLACGCQ
jgi:hypothetical protein